MKIPRLLTGTTQRPPAVIPARARRLNRMKNIFHSRPGKTAPRAARWAVGITLAAFLAGGGVALATSGGTVNASGQSGAGASNGQLNALLSASGTASAGTTASGTASASTGT